jgi:SPP1 gp7 family putative phage head morphogenesis protein
MRNSAYWKERSERRERFYQEKSKKVYRKIEKTYKEAFKDINREAQNIIKNMANVSDKEAYIFRLERLRRLKRNIFEKFRNVAKNEVELNKTRYAELLPEAYNRTIYDSAIRLGLGFDFAQIPQKAIDALLRDKWSGANFSSYIWANTGKTAQKAYDIIAAGLTSGASIRDMTLKLKSTSVLNVVNKNVYDINAKLKRLEDFASYAAERVIRTETNYYSNQGELMAYTEIGIKRYRYLATLDNRTSELCQKRDNKIYDLKDAEVGKNYPPLHPNCRSTVTAVFDEDNISDLTRRAKDPKTGKYIEVPADMSYKEWAKVFLFNKGGK